MSSIFPKWVNRLPLILAIFGAGASVSAVGGVWYYFSPKFTDAGYRPEQPIPYSHKLHAGILGMDCRYCHNGVERGAYATVPPTQICMNCHKTIKPQSPLLIPLQKSAATDTPVPWVRIHDLPDFVHFNHSIHINAGVGCASCHGRIDQMTVVHQVEPLSMGWCLDCHRNPAPNIRPKSEITNMGYSIDPKQGRLLVQQNKLHPPENCSACHF